uniref:Ubiquitin-associated protein 1 n=1 Tax=Lygus hesperus TaxID=30085 RepID=A0A0A9YM52_LYGHE
MKNEGIERVTIMKGTHRNLRRGDPGRLREGPSGNKSGFRRGRTTETKKPPRNRIEKGKKQRTRQPPTKPETPETAQRVTHEQAIPYPTSFSYNRLQFDIISARSTKEKEERKVNRWKTQIG